MSIWCVTAASGVMILGPRRLCAYKSMDCAAAAGMELTMTVLKKLIGSSSNELPVCVASGAAIDFCNKFSDFIDFDNLRGDGQRAADVSDKRNNEHLFFSFVCQGQGHGL